MIYEQPIKNIRIHLIPLVIKAMQIKNHNGRLLLAPLKDSHLKIDYIESWQGYKVPGTLFHAFKTYRKYKNKENVKLLYSIKIKKC